MLDAVSSRTFQAEHKIKPTDFTRDRSLNFSRTFLLILQQSKSSLQRRLNQFFSKLPGVSQVTAGAFSLARMKLSHTAFESLNRQLVDDFHNQSPEKEGAGLFKRVFAADGSRLELPDEEGIAETFGRANKNDSAKPQALVSTLFDLQNKLVVNATINHCCSDENRLAIDHLHLLGKGDLLILDRGYKSLWLMLEMQRREIDFLIRLPSNAFKEVTLFMASRKTDQIVEIFPSQSAQKTCLELGIPIKSLKARLIKVKLKTGETEVLITSLTDRELCPESIFGALYALR